METSDTLARIERDLSVSEDAMRSIPAAAAESAADTGPFGPIIDMYTRADAIADGTLIAAPESIAAEAGLPLSVALTQAAWADCVQWSDADSARQVPQDEEGRLWDVLYMSAFTARRYRGEMTFIVQVYRVPRAGRARAARPVELKFSFHAGDNGEAVATISLPDED